ncbi:MAG: sensor histidine kinase [Phycisphaerales bacterium]
MSVVLWSSLAGLSGLGVGFAAAWFWTKRWARRQLALVRSAERRARDAERLAELGSMTGGLAHEIKNPLSTIGLNAQLLAEGIADLSPQNDDTARLTRRVGALAREVERLSGILTDFLDFAGDRRLSPAPTDLNDLIGELVDFLHPQADRQGVRLRSALPQPTVWASVDGALVKQALLNLMLNAMQAMEANDAAQPRELLVRLEAVDSEDGPMAVVRVADTGPGMDDSVRAQIFAPYFTTKPGGTGLGLPTTRRIVEQHGGRIEVYSAPGHGTECVISLPIESEGSTVDA